MRISAVTWRAASLSWQLSSAILDVLRVRAANLSQKWSMVIQELAEVSFTDISHGGEGIGRLEGKVVFAPYVLPGEKARIRLIEDRKSYMRGEVVEILTPSPQRVKPPCRHFGECGGCHWQHVTYPAQLALKEEIVRAQLARLGGLLQAPVQPVLGMDFPWNYRNHVQFAVDPDGALGYLAARSHRVVAIEECYLLHAYLEDILAALDVEWPALRRLSLRAGINTGDLMVILETESAEQPDLEVDFPASFVWLPASGEAVSLIGNDYIREEIGGRTFRISAPSFFQVNTAQTEHLVRLVQEGLQPSGDELLLDLYCGVGTFGLNLATQVGRVIGVEESAVALDDAVENAADLPNVEFWEGRVADALPEVEDPVQLAIVDPPRSGIEPEALVALISLAPRRLVYVSCDPASLARDLKVLVAAGYKLESVQPVDMFPQTYHVESVTVMSRDG